MSNNTWDDYAEGWDSNPEVITYSNRAFQSLTDAIDCSDARILDFGCGTGLLTEKLSTQASAVVAIDPAAKMISVLNDKQLQNVVTIQAELTQQLIDHNKHLQTRFDLIVASSALAFVRDYKQTLLLLKQLLTDNGRLVQWDWLRENGDDGIGFTREDIANTFQDIGFADIQVTTPFSLGTGENSMEVVMGIATNTR